MHALDLTQGSITKNVALFALPLLVTSFVQQLYSAADLLFVGNVLGTNAAAALGIGSLLITILVGLFSGVAVGTNVLVARLSGAREQNQLYSAITSALSVSVLSGCILIVAGEILAEPFVSIMRTPSEAATDALVYVRFGVAASLPIAVFNTAAGALRGLGDSRGPLIAQLIGGLCNILFNWLALCVFKWGIGGCAAATFMSNALSAIIAYVMLDKTSAIGLKSINPLSIDRSVVAFIAKFGVPVGVQTVAIVISNVVVQHQIDLMGVTAVAAFTVYLKAELPIYFVILAIGQTTTTFVAQNFGAREFDRCKKGIWICQVMCIALTVLLSLVMLGIGREAFWLFVKDEKVISTGLVMIGITFPLYFVYSVLEVQGDALRGYGHSLGPAVIVLLNICLLRVVLVIAFTSQGMGIEAIAMSYPITWTTTAVCMLLLRLYLAKTAKR